VLALALLLATLGALVSPRLSAPPLERAEVYFADAARSMVESGDWLIPRYEGRPFFDKPILTYWAMAASMKAFGASPAAARLVPLVAALLVVLATAWLGTLLFDRRSALAGGIVLATTIAFLSFARVAMSDMLLALFTTLAVALGVRAYRSFGAGLTLVLLGAVLGLGFATKGPIALVVPGLAFVLLVFQQRERPIPCGLGALALALAAFTVVGLGWFALVYRRLGSEPLVFFFFRENLERLAGESFDVGRPFWFYPPAYLAEGLPWSVFLPIALWRLLRSHEDEERRASRLLAGWAALVLVPLSLSRGKIDYYLLPLYPALSLLVGRYFAIVPWRRLDVVWARVALVLGALAAADVLVHPPRLPEPWLPVPAVRALLVATLVLAGIALALAAVRPRAGQVMAVLAGTVSAVFFLLVGWFLPAFAERQPNRAIAADVARERLYRPQARLAFCADPSHARREVLVAVRHAAVEQCDLWSLAGSREPYLLLVDPAHDASFHVLPKYRHVASYQYLPAKTLTFEGLFARPEPGELVLCANFKTKDPLAERTRKREYRKAIQREKALAAQAAARARR
jgi:4-amino-4-deoxy-L-arabinose transferase-like glycosyltransferase